EERRGSCEPFLGKVEHPAGPGDGRALVAVDGDPGPTRVLICERSGDALEERSVTQGVAASRPGEIRSGGYASGNDAQRVGRSIEPVGELSLDTRQRGLLRFAEPVALDAPTGQADEK